MWAKKNDPFSGRLLTAALIIATLIFAMIAMLAISEVVQP